MGAHKFWIGWLKVVALALILYALLVVFFNQSAFFNYFNRNIDLAFPSLAGNPDALRMRQWLNSILGSILLGWGITLCFIVWFPLQRKESWAWNAIFYGMFAWYVFDTIITLSLGVNFIILFNTFIVLQVLGPLLFVRSYFKGSITIKS